MSINIGGYIFDGPYNDPDEIKEELGVYVVLCLVDGMPRSHAVKIGLDFFNISKPPPYPPLHLKWIVMYRPIHWMIQSSLKFV